MILIRGNILDENGEKGACDEIGGKKFPSLLPPKSRYLIFLYFTYSLPTPSLTRSEEEEGSNKLD